MTSSAVRELLKVTERPEVISFAGGLPAPESFPVEEVAEAAARVLRDAGPQALQYGPTEGYGPLREWVAEQMRVAGVPVSADQVLITTGSQQTLDLLGKVFVDMGDKIVVESPTYLAALQVWNLYGARYLVAPTDDDGMRTDDLAATLARRPKLIYCLPNFQNPSGVTLTPARRACLVELAAAHDAMIVEDDPYRELRFEGEHLDRLITSDAARRRGTDERYMGGVIYTSTFSKVISPGLRVGYVVAAREAIARLVQAKQSSDLHTATFNQMLIYALAMSGVIERNARAVARLYRARRDAMLAALSEHFPPGVTWTHPAGGLFLWVTLPPHLDATDLLEEAVARNVAFVPGAPFHPAGGANTLRLNFSYASPERIHEGIARLGLALRAHLDAPAMAFATADV
jgi:2-aminoadipate transaminase